MIADARATGESERARLLTACRRFVFHPDIEDTDPQKLPNYDKGGTITGFFSTNEKFDKPTGVAGSIATASFPPQAEVNLSYRIVNGKRVYVGTIGSEAVNAHSNPWLADEFDRRFFEGITTIDLNLRYSKPPWPNST